MFTYVTTSAIGIQEDAMKNNHGVRLSLLLRSPASCPAQPERQMPCGF
jgi:hypothetical protein